VLAAFAALEPDARDLDHVLAPGSRPSMALIQA
jgi:hypothetical protein